MVPKLVSNFYLRNLIVFLLFRSPRVLQEIVANGNFSLERAGNEFGYFCLYLYFIFHSRVLYEKLLPSKKYLAYLALMLLSLFVWREATSYLQWQLFFRKPYELHYQIKELKEHDWMFWLLAYWMDLVYIYIALGVYLAFKYFDERTRSLQVENLRMDLELKQLNAQLNPHFLFNSLNNIYSHLLRGSENGQELILKLSELMRYILDSNKKQLVSINEELDFIENYIAFEKERLGSRCHVNYHKEISSQDFKLIPLILFGFIENAFKHGTNFIGRSEIGIGIYADDKTLKLKVSNSVFLSGLVSPGIGLANTKRRLQLIYPGKHSLQIKKNQGHYELLLEISQTV